MINELIEQIGGRAALQDLIDNPRMANCDETAFLARALLAVLDGQENSTIRKRKALLWLERQQMAHPGMNEVRYAIDLITLPPAASVPDGWKLVPIEPTIEMREAYHQAEEDFQDCCGTSPDSHWAAMLAAAPAPGGDGG